MTFITTHFKKLTTETTCFLSQLLSKKLHQSINQSINQSLLFQAAWPIETQDKTDRY